MKFIILLILLASINVMADEQSELKGCGTNSYEEADGTADWWFQYWSIRHFCFIEDEYGLKIIRVTHHDKRQEFLLARVL